MAPRNNDMNSSYNQKNYPLEENDSEIEIKNIVPNLLHKKHKVVKIVKSHLQRIQREGIFCDLLEAEFFPKENELKQDKELVTPQDIELRKLIVESSSTQVTAPKEGPKKSPKRNRRSLTETQPTDAEWNETTDQSNTTVRKTSSRSGSLTALFCKYLFAFLLALFLIALLVVWVSSGPLSNSSPHTPIRRSLIWADSQCALEKKCLLRWSQSQYSE